MGRGSEAVAVPSPDSVVLSQDHADSESPATEGSELWGLEDDMFGGIVPFKFQTPGEGLAFAYCEY